MIVDLRRIAGVLSPWLGEELLSDAPWLCTGVQRKLYTDAIDAGSLLAISQGLDSFLCLSVKELTRDSMIVRLNDRTRVRMQMSDFSVLADELMYLLFEKFPLDARHLMALRDYSMRTNSLSAIRCLLTRFRDYESEDELLKLSKIVRECYPMLRWHSWLQ